MFQQAQNNLSIGKAVCELPLEPQENAFAVQLVKLLTCSMKSIFGKKIKMILWVKIFYIWAVGYVSFRHVREKSSLSLAIRMFKYYLFALG